MPHNEIISGKPVKVKAIMVGAVLRCWDGLYGWQYFQVLHVFDEGFDVLRIGGDNEQLWLTRAGPTPIEADMDNLPDEVLEAVMRYQMRKGES